MVQKRPKQPKKTDELLKFKGNKETKAANICIRFTVSELHSMKAHAKKGDFPSLSGLIRQILADAGALG